MVSISEDASLWLETRASIKKELEPPGAEGGRISLSWNDCSIKQNGTRHSWLLLLSPVFLPSC